MSLPSVHEDEALYEWYTSATIQGIVTSDGGHTITERGFWYCDIHTSYYNADKVIVAGTTGEYHYDASGLTPDTNYQYWAYATNADGTTVAWASPMYFSTLPLTPTVWTVAISAITGTSAASGGSGLSAGAGTISVKGVCWNTTGGPTTANSKTTDGGGTADYASAISGLTVGVTYYVRAYATNEYGTSYGAQLGFVACTTPTVGTATATAIGANTAASGGNCTSDGGSPVTARGVCWCLHALGRNPDIALDATHTHDGTDHGEFSSAITGLLASTAYHYVAYATNSKGTAYGGVLELTTLAQSVTTAAVTAIDHHDGTATSGGTASAEPPVIDHQGICYCLASHGTPNLTDTVTDDGSGAGAYVSAMTGLTPDTLYNVVAYATRADESTIYGATVSFLSTVHFTGAIARSTVWAEALTAAKILEDSQAGMQYYGRSLAKGTVVISGMVENRKGAKVPAHHVRAGWWIQNMEWLPDPTLPAPVLYVTGHSVDLAAKKNALTIGEDWMEKEIGVRMAELLATPVPVVVEPEYVEGYVEAEPVVPEPIPEPVPATDPWAKDNGQSGPAPKTRSRRGKRVITTHDESGYSRKRKW